MFLSDTICSWLYDEKSQIEELEENKGVIRGRESEKNRQCNGKEFIFFSKRKKKHNQKQTLIHETLHTKPPSGWVTRTPQNQR